MTIDEKEGQISIFNNGKPIPIVIHKDHHIWVPELTFGHLLAGSNFDVWFQLFLFSVVLNLSWTVSSFFRILRRRLLVDEMAMVISIRFSSLSCFRIVCISYSVSQVRSCVTFSRLNSRWKLAIQSMTVPTNKRGQTTWRKRESLKSSIQHPVILFVSNSSLIFACFILMDWMKILLPYSQNVSTILLVSFCLFFFLVVTLICHFHFPPRILLVWVDDMFPFAFFIMLFLFLLITRVHWEESCCEIEWWHYSSQDFQGLCESLPSPRRRSVLLQSQWPVSLFFFSHCCVVFGYLRNSVSLGFCLFFLSRFSFFLPHFYLILYSLQSWLFFPSISSTPFCSILLVVFSQLGVSSCHVRLGSYAASQFRQQHQHSERFVSLLPFPCSFSLSPLFLDISLLIQSVSLFLYFFFLFLFFSCFLCV